MEDKAKTGKTVCPPSIHPVDNVSKIVPVSTVLSSKGKAWHGIDVMHVRHNIHEIKVPGYTSHLVVVYLGRPFKMVERVEGRVYESCVSKGDVTVVPAYMPSQWHWTGQEEANLLQLYLKPEFIREVAAGVSDVNPDRIEMLNSLGARDPKIVNIGSSLLSELKNEGVSSCLYAESLANELAVHLLKYYTTAEQQLIREYSGGLPRYKLRRATDFIQANLDRDVALNEIAEAAETSPFHFARLFKQATGLSAHQYILQQRVEEAKRLLANEDLPIADIAFRLGFSSQSHFTAIFRKLTATTPKAYRKAL